MAHDPQVEVYEVGGVPVAAIDMAGLVASMRRFFARGPAATGSFVAFCGAHGIVESQKNVQVKDAHRAAWLTVADGRPLFWLGRLLGFRSVDQVPGIESVEIVCRAGLPLGWTHYFLGGAEGVAQELAAEMARRVPGLRVAGSETPPFRSLSADEVEAMRARVRDSGAQVAWIGLGAPKQELFMAANAPHLPGVLCMGVGAAFDVNTGRVRRAPRLLRGMGLEWFYRLAVEPRRLWSRYSVAVPLFLKVALGSLLARTGPAA